MAIELLKEDIEKIRNCKTLDKILKVNEEIFNKYRYRTTCDGVTYGSNKSDFALAITLAKYTKPYLLFYQFIHLFKELF